MLNNTMPSGTPGVLKQHQLQPGKQGHQTRMTSGCQVMR